jgi:hypothetical protein
MLKISNVCNFLILLNSLLHKVSNYAPKKMSFKTKKVYIQWVAIECFLLTLHRNNMLKKEY